MTELTRMQMLQIGFETDRHAYNAWLKRCRMRLGRGVRKKPVVEIEAREGLFVKDKCKKGHEYTSANTYTYINTKGNPARSCRACARIKKRRPKKCVAQT